MAAWHPYIRSTAVNVLRMVKLFGWEIKIAQRIDQSRQQELKLLWKSKVYLKSSSTCFFLSFYRPSEYATLLSGRSNISLLQCVPIAHINDTSNGIPFLSMLLTYIVYTVIMKQQLNGSALFYVNLSLANSLVFSSI
jgi:hypothetical protein